MALRIIARSVHGLEWVCADEIVAAVPGVDDLRLARREIAFRVPAADRALLDLRTVDDVFLHVGEVSDVGTTKDALGGLRRLTDLPWHAALAALPRDLPARPRLDVVASLEGRRAYNRFAVEAAAGAALAPRLGADFVARTGNAPAGAPTDLTVRLFLRGPVAIAALRLAARPLHRREYKQDTGPGTLHPPLAAALARIAAPAPGEVVADPFCGDGTIAIEAALAYPHARVIATDLDPARLANAAANARRAGVAVDLAVADAGTGIRPADAVLTNPPWNLAVDATGTLAGSLDRFWRGLPAGTRLCAVTDADLAVPTATTLAVPIRLAGRLSHVLLAGGALPAGLAAWRDRAVAAGVGLG